MMFRDQAQTDAVCHVVLDCIDLGHIWTSEGPTEEAREIRGLGIRRLDRHSWLVFRLVWELWGEPDEEVRTLGMEVVRGLQGAAAKGVARLMLAYASDGSNGIDKWLIDAAAQSSLDKAADARLEASLNERALAQYKPDDPMAIELRARVNDARQRANEYEQRAVEAATLNAGRLPKGNAQN